MIIKRFVGITETFNTHIREIGLSSVALILAAGVALFVTTTDNWPRTTELLVSMVIAGLIFIRPAIGLWLLLITLPFQQFFPIDIPIGRLTLPRSIVLVTMLTLIIHKLIVRPSHGRNFKTPFNRAILGLLIAWITSSFMSINIDPATQIQVYIDPYQTHLARQQPFIKSYTETISYLVSISALYIMSSVLSSFKLVQSAIKFWIIGAVIACLIGIYATLGYYYNLPVPEEVSNTYYLSDPRSLAEVSRVRSVASEPRYFTYYLITILPFLIVTGLYKQYIISRRFHIGDLVLIGLSFWWTMSRSMIIMGFVAMVILPFISIMIGSKMSHFNPVISLGKAILYLFILLALAAGLLFIISGVNMKNTFYTLVETINPYHRSVGSQLINNIVALNLFLENPILGVGIGNYVFFANPSSIPAWSPFYHDISDTVVFVTNVYLQTLSEAGLVGMVALLYLFGTIGLSAIRTIRMAKDERSNAMSVGLAGSFIMIIVAVAFIPNFFNPETWVVLGFISVMCRYAREEPCRSFGTTLP